MTRDTGSARSVCARLRRSGAAALLAVVAVLLSGCIAIPTSGSVAAAGEVGGGEAPELVFQPNGPVEGASPEAIITGFVQAAIGPQSSYAVARQFLSTGFADQWDPNAGVLVRSGQQSTARLDEDSYELSFTATASVDASGQYTSLASPQPATLTFEMVKQRGEWRIAETPDGIVLTEQYFEDIFEPYPLYFFAPGFQNLVPDLRWFPNLATTSLRLVRGLLAGPSEWMQPPAVVTAFPEGTEALLVNVENGSAVVDLSAEARADTVALQRMKLQLTSTLSSVLSIQSVEVSIERTPTTIPDLGGAGPATDPQVDGSPLVLADGTFGFLTNGETEPLPVVGERIAALQPTAVTLGADEISAAVLNAAGVWSVRRDEDALLVDTRPGLIPPSLDTEGFVWSVPAEDPTAMLAIRANGEGGAVGTSWGEGARIASIDVSRDGARLLALLDSAQGPRLAVASIVRDENGTPTRLTSPVLELEAEPGTPVDATWVDNVTVATLTRPTPGEEPVVTLQQVSGRVTNLGEVRGAVSIVGGNGRSNLRVLTAEGLLHVPRGNGWQRAGANVSVLATQR
jgi:hypothetical protein